MGDRASEDVLGTTSRVLAILQRGRGDTSALLKNTTALMAATVNEDQLKGVFRTPEEAAALVSTMAEARPEEAEVLSRAALRALRSEKITAATGAGPLESFGSSAQKFADLVNRRSAAENRPIQDIIAEYAPDEREKVALATLVSKGVGPGGTLAARAEYAKGFGTESALSAIRKFQGTDAGLSRMADAGLELEKAKRAGTFSGVDILRKQATRELYAEGGIDTSSAEIEKYVSGVTSFGLVPNLERQKIDYRVAEILQRRAGQAGFDTGVFGEAGRFGSLSASRLNNAFTNEGRVENFNQAIEQIRGRGGDPMRDAADRIGRAADRIAAPGIPSALPVGPAAGAPMRR